MAREVKIEWRARFSDIDEEVMSEEVEFYLKCSYRRFLRHKFDLESEISTHVHITFFSLAALEPLLRNRRDSRRSGLGTPDEPYAATRYWEVLSQKSSTISEANGISLPKTSRIIPDYSFAVRDTPDGSDSRSRAHIELKGPHSRLVHEDEIR